MYKIITMTKTKKRSLRLIKWVEKNLTLFIGIGIGFSLTLIILIVAMIWIADRPWPGVSLAGEPVGLTLKQQIQARLINRLQQFRQLVLVYDQRVWTIPLTRIGWQPDVSTSVQTAIDDHKHWRTWNQLPQLFTTGIDLPVVSQYSQELLSQQLSLISEELYIPAVDPEVITSQADQSITLNPGSDGQQVNQTQLLNQVQQALTHLDSLPISIPVETVTVQLTAEEESQLTDLARQLKNKQLILEEHGRKIIWTGDQLIKLLGKGGVEPQKLTDQLKFLASETNIPAQNAEFQFNSQTNKVEQFKPEVIGQTLEIDQTTQEALRELQQLARSATDSAQLQLTYQSVYPEILVADINQLGIEELIGKGISNYKGSITGRKYNIAHAAGQISGTLVKPGEEFSFNQAVGEVSASTGYKKSYVIRSGQTILDDGGGVCQVSTTVFRAALNTGLPITERHAHSYRVHYYENDAKPGLDATVYAPSVDLKFMNDTPGYILIQTKVDEPHTTLTVEIYGTSDGRKSEISNQRVWGITAPPDDLYVDDPTLPPGTIKQVEYKSWGTKAAFDWKVTRDGQILQERTFYSNFRPWGAVFLRGPGA